MVLAFLCVIVVTGGIVVSSSTWSPAGPMSSSATVLVRVDVCIAHVACVVRAISFLVLVFAFALPLPFLRVSIRILLSSSAHVPFPADTVGFAPKFREE